MKRFSSILFCFLLAWGVGLGCSKKSNPDQNNSLNLKAIGELASKKVVTKPGAGVTQNKESFPPANLLTAKKEETPIQNFTSFKTQDSSAINTQHSNLAGTSQQLVVSEPAPAAVGENPSVNPSVPSGGNEISNPTVPLAPPAQNLIAAVPATPFPPTRSITPSSLAVPLAAPVNPTALNTSNLNVPSQPPVSSTVSLPNATTLSAPMPINNLKVELPLAPTRSIAPSSLTVPISTPVAPTALNTGNLNLPLQPPLSSTAPLPNATARIEVAPVPLQTASPPIALRVGSATPQPLTVANGSASGTDSSTGGSASGGGSTGNDSGGSSAGTEGGSGPGGQPTGGQWTAAGLNLYAQNSRGGILSSEVLAPRIAAYLNPSAQNSGTVSAPPLSIPMGDERVPYFLSFMNGLPDDIVVLPASLADGTHQFPEASLREFFKRSTDPQTGKEIDEYRPVTTGRVTLVYFEQAPFPKMKNGDKVDSIHHQFEYELSLDPVSMQQNGYGPARVWQYPISPSAQDGNQANVTLGDLPLKKGFYAIWLYDPDLFFTPTLGQEQAMEDKRARCKAALEKAPSPVDGAVELPVESLDCPYYFNHFVRAIAIMDAPPPPPAPAPATTPTPSTGPLLIPYSLDRISFRRLFPF